MFCGMDEGLLNDLLECSVCLERLDTSSRVLPCQHTFCLKCIKVIVESHKELRCPECRILVEAKVEELPPNVLLMRILEGMKNSSTPRKPGPGAPQHRTRTHHVHQTQQQASQHAPGTVRGSDGKPLPPHARAIHDFRSKELGDLSFKKGETIILQKRVDQFWFHGECNGRSGLFPITYVQIVVPLPVPTALCKALYDFRMSAPDEEGCLAFDKGAIIAVHRRVDENWAEGRIEERVGIFPIAFVELNKAATALMNSPTINRPVPPLPDHARPSHSDHTHLQHHLHRYQNMSISTPTPTPTQSTYQNVTPMAQSHPLFNQPTLLPRNLLEPQTKHLDLIHLTNINTTNNGPQTMIQSVSRINDNIDRLRASKYENYSTPKKTESTYQNVRINEHFPVAVANFNANNSDSSSSVTNSIGASTSPNSSNTSSTESAVPSLPSSPENAERNTTVTQGNTTLNSTETEQESQLNNSVGTLSLNESSTATNTSLNVSLPGNEVESQKVECQESSSKNEPTRLDVASSSKAQNPMRSSGPDSLLNFGLGLQAALSPSHVKEGYVSRGQREKRHSLTPSTHLGSNPNAGQNRHSAEILATSLLDHMPERERNRPERERERERRRRRSRSNERPLPATYIALYPYKPRKPDELQLNKGEVYIVVERCRDGWYKGAAASGGGGGLFPGNYVSALPPPRHVAQRTVHDKIPSHRSLSPANPMAPSSQSLGTNGQSSGTSCQPIANQSTSQPASLIGLTAPDAPPRALSPNTSNIVAQPTGSYPWPAWSDSAAKSDKSKDKSKGDKPQSTGVSLMKRLAAMKKCKSPPPAYSMDNPVFDEGPGTSSAPPATQQQPVHVSPWHAQSQPQHKKSQSLDVTTAKRDRDRHHSQPSKERFRCIVPYPPNSEYELELKVDDIVIVHRKRGDGWYKGTLQRTGRTGLFPASFVQSCPAE